MTAGGRARALGAWLLCLGLIPAADAFATRADGDVLAKLTALAEQAAEDARGVAAAWEQLEASLDLEPPRAAGEFARYGAAVVELAAGLDADGPRFPLARRAVERLRAGPPGLDRALVETAVADAWARAGRFAEALDAVHGALAALAPEDARAADLRWRLRADEADYLRFLGRAGEADRAIEALLAEPLPDPIALRLLGIRGQARLVAGVLDAAASDLATAVARARAAHRAGLVDDAALAAALLRWVTFLIPQGNYAEAEERAAEVLALAGLPPGHVAMAHACDGLARIERRRREWARDPAAPWSAQAARAALTSALEGVPAGSPMEVQVRLGLAELDLLEGRGEEARARLAELRAGAALPPALAGVAATLELRLAAESGAPAERAAALDFALEALEGLLAAWDAQPVRPGGVGFLHFRTRRALLVEAIGALLELEGPEQGARRALVLLLAAGARSSDVRRSGLGAVDYDTLRAGLADGEGWIVYAASVERAFAFAVDREGVLAVELEPGQVLEDAARAFMDDLFDPPSAGAAGRRRAERLGAGARRLGAALLPEPIAARASTWRTVAIGGAELVGDPAFAALDVPGLGVLGLERGLVHWPSPAGVLARRASKDAAQELVSARVVVLAEPRLASEQARAWPRLSLLPPPGAASVAPHFRGRGVEWLAGEVAGRSALAEAAPAAAWVLLAHGVLVEGRERPATLLLAPCAANPSGELDGAGLESLRLPPVVLLASCGAARGPARYGDSAASHLAGAALFAGARAVVLSRADLEYRAAAALARGFLERLAEGDDAGSALSEARRRLAAHPDTADPFHWAVYELHGDALTAPLVAGGVKFDVQRPRLGPWLGAGALLLLLACLPWLRRRPRAVSTVGAKGQDPGQLP